jgi:hypothetical protein
LYQSASPTTQDAQIPVALSSPLTLSSIVPIATSIRNLANAEPPHRKQLGFIWQPILAFSAIHSTDGLADFMVGLAN